MFWILYLLPPAYMASRVAPRFGMLAGIAALVATLAAQSMLLFWLVPRRESEPAPAGPVGQPPARPPRQRLRMRTGERARFKSLTVFEANEGQVPGQAERRLFDVLRQLIARYVDIEQGVDGSEAAMVQAHELGSAQDAAQASHSHALVVFRSRDCAWCGFRLGNESFRFRAGSVTRLELGVIEPVRFTTGSCLAWFWFKDGPKNRPPGSNDVYMCRGDVDLAPADSDEHAAAWEYVFGEIAGVFGVKFEVGHSTDV